jgi:hypothetical protein
LVALFLDLTSFLADLPCGGKKQTLQVNASTLLVSYILDKNALLVVAHKGHAVTVQQNNVQVINFRVEDLNSLQRIVHNCVDQNFAKTGTAEIEQVTIGHAEVSAKVNGHLELSHLI